MDTIYRWSIIANVLEVILELILIIILNVHNFVFTISWNQKYLNNNT